MTFELRFTRSNASMSFGSSPTAPYFATRSSPRTLRSYHLMRRQLSARIALIDLRTTATGHRDGTVMIRGSMRTNFPAHRRRVIGVAFSPDGRILATGGEEGTAKLWEVARHREIATLKGHLRSVHSLGISPDSRRLGTVGGDEEAVKLWDLHTDQSGRSCFSVDLRTSRA